LQNFPSGGLSRAFKIGELFTENFKNSVDDARSWGMLTIPVDVKVERAKVLAGADLAGSR
jgi:hypothetical protein